ncbi:MAG: hypothetical protein PHY93_16170 [Bacteriovorax sp.]|nr:hypothetical protein [Bacteriovorax sp.]
MDILELNRDELGSPSNDGKQTGFDITYTFLVYEQINASVHREIINESLSSAIVTCQVSAVEDGDRTVKIEDQKCTIKASKLITEATASF